MANPQPGNAAFVGFEMVMQPIAYPVDLVTGSTSAIISTTTTTTDEVPSAPLDIAVAQAEISQLRLENALLHRKLFQEQQQIGRLMDHVNRLARALGEAKRTQAAPNQ